MRWLHGMVIVSSVSFGSLIVTHLETSRAPSAIKRSAALPQLIGSWRLVSRIVTQEDGTPIQDPGLGPTPAGYLIYDSSGHMAVQIMRRSRSAAIDCATAATAPVNNSQALNGYDAYFGTFVVDETRHTVTHHLEGALVATDVGKSLLRGFEVAGDQLTLSVAIDSPEGKQIRTLKWARVH